MTRVGASSTSRIGRGTPGPWNDFDELLAEPFIRGRELTVAVLGEEALCVTELKPKADFKWQPADFEAVQRAVDASRALAPADRSNDPLDPTRGWRLETR